MAEWPKALYPAMAGRAANEVSLIRIAGSQPVADPPLAENPNNRKNHSGEVAEWPKALYPAMAGRAANEVSLIRIAGSQPEADPPLAENPNNSTTYGFGPVVIPGLTRHRRGGVPSRCGRIQTKT